MYSYSFKSSAEPTYANWASAILYHNLKSDWQVSIPNDRSATVNDAKKFSLEYLKKFEEICLRFTSQTSDNGFAKADGVFKIDNEISYKVGFFCNKQIISSYFQEEGSELVSVTHDSFDAAVSDFLSHIV